MCQEDVGLWCELGKPDAVARPALFLDRDGVIVVDTDYLGCADDVHMIEGMADAIARCNALRIPVVVVTNQSGIARGRYDWTGFGAVQATLAAELAAAGAHLDGVLACAYHGEGLGQLRVEGHPWRKPNPGMIVAAANGMNLDLARSWIVGDKTSDLVAGAAAGLAGGTLVASSDQEGHDALALAGPRFAVELAANPVEALAGLIASGRFVD